MRKLLLPAAALAVAAALASGCSSSPSYPHAWCGPLITAFHARDSPSAYLAALESLAASGTPDGTLVKDVTGYEGVEYDLYGGGQGFPGDVAAARTDLAKVGADLKALNAECGQPADAYASDNV